MLTANHLEELLEGFTASDFENLSDYVLTRLAIERMKRNMGLIETSALKTIIHAEFVGRGWDVTFKLIEPD